MKIKKLDWGLHPTSYEQIKKLKNIENNRFDLGQFEKYADDKNCRFIGYFEDGELQAATVITLNYLGLNEIFGRELQSFKKGAGRKLLNAILNQPHPFPVILLCDPSADKGLLNYYRSFNKLEEITFPTNFWGNGEEHIFYYGDVDPKKLRKAAIEKWS